MSRDWLKRRADPNWNIGFLCAKPGSLPDRAGGEDFLKLKACDWMASRQSNCDDSVLAACLPD